MRIFLLLFLISSACAQSPVPAPQWGPLEGPSLDTERTELAERSRQGIESFNHALKKFDYGTGEDAKVFKKLSDLMTQAVSAKDTFKFISEHNDEMTEHLLHLSQFAFKKKDVNMEVTMTLVLVAIQDKSHKSDRELSKPVRDQVQQLLDLNPQEVWAYTTKATWLESTGAPKPEIVKVLAQCLKNALEKDPCQKLYKSLISGYTAPTECLSKNIEDGFGILLEPVNSNTKHKRIYGENNDSWYVNPELYLTKKYIKSISKRYDVWGREEIFIDFFASSAAQIKRLKSKKYKRAFIVVDDQVLASFERLPNPFPNPAVVTLKPDSKIQLFSAVCAHPEGMKIPKELDIQTYQ